MRASPESTKESGPISHGVMARMQAASPTGLGVRIIVAGLLLIIGLLATNELVSSQEITLRNQLHEQIVLHAATMRSRLESALNSTVYLAQGLVAYIKSVDNIKPARVEEALRAVFEVNDRIRNIGLAPDNVLTYVYPTKGNQAALHLNYRALPAQWPSVQRAMELRQSVLAGPVNLVQGGRGIINRTPVYLSDGRYWGMISVVINLDKLLSDIELIEYVDGVRYYLKGDNAGATPNDAIIGSSEILNTDPIRMQIAVPGGNWTLMAVPKEGWDVPQTPLLLLRCIGTLLSVFLAGFVWALLHGRAIARQNNAQLASLNQKLHEMNSTLEEITRQDTLTGIANRRSFDEAFTRAWAHAKRNKQSISVLMIDIDHFKSINDLHGHATGDAYLVEVARRLSNCVRRGEEILARYGGEEFVVLSPGIDHAQALDLGERLRTAINTDPFKVGPGSEQNVSMTISVGVATTVPDNAISPMKLCADADSALYQAKKNGRNRVCSAVQ